MNRDRSFALTIAGFNALGYALATGIPTYVDPLLKSSVYGTRRYPLGFWVLGLAPLLFALVYGCERVSRSRNVRIIVPGMVVLLFGLAVLPNFRPPFPHMNVFGWTCVYALCTLVSSWVHHVPTELEYVLNPSVPVQARVERVKESVSLWRTFALSLSFGYLAVLVPWVRLQWETSFPDIGNDRPAQVLILQVCVVQTVCFSGFAIFGPIAESFRKASLAADSLLRIGDGEPQEKPLLR